MTFFILLNREIFVITLASQIYFEKTEKSKMFLISYVVLRGMAS